jgi:hypothetical protein
MPKSTKTTTKKRTQVKKVPKSKRKLNERELSNVKGGVIGTDQGIFKGSKSK